MEIKNFLFNFILATLQNWGLHVIATVIFFSVLMFLLRTVLMSVSTRYAKFNRADRNNFDVSCMAFSHAVLSVVLVARAFAYGQPIVDNWGAFENVAGQAFAFSTGYFFWDLVVCVVFDWGFQFQLHAVFCTCVYFCCLAGYAQWYGLYFLLYELSTPFLNLRTIFKMLNLSAQLRAANDVVFGVVFLFARILVGLPMSAFFLRDAVMDGVLGGKAEFAGPVIYLIVANLGLNTLNIVWFNKIARMAARPLNQRAKTGGKK